MSGHSKWSKIKHKKGALDAKRSKLFTKAIKEITNKKINAKVVYKDNEVIDIAPFELKLYENLKSKKFEDYNSALDFILIKKLASMIEDKKTKTYDDKIKK